jgi:hypothetical protein
MNSLARALAALYADTSFLTEARAPGWGDRATVPSAIASARALEHAPVALVPGRRDARKHCECV